MQKAYDLNPGKDETGCALVDILVELEEEVSSRYKISSKNCLQIYTVSLNSKFIVTIIHNCEQWRYSK